MTQPGDISRTLPLAGNDSGPASGGCGCGCSGHGDQAPVGEQTVASDPQAANAPQAATSGTYAVTGMTCGHCANAVREEVGAIDGVSEVSVDLVADGVSTVTVQSDRPIAQDAIAGALAEAGDYHLA